MTKTGIDAINDHMTPEEPSHVTTIDQHAGDHSTGLPEMQLAEVCTYYSHHSQESWESLDADAKTWWVETLADLHAAEVELAECNAGVRAAAKELIADRMPPDDLESAPAIIRGAIEDVTADPEFYAAAE